MTRQQLQTRIAANLNEALMDSDEIRIQPDPFGGWRVLVVSKSFDGRTPSERKLAALNKIDERELQWTELLTPQELGWAGSLFTDSDLYQLPLWSDALARASAKSEQVSPVVFPSSLDTDLPVPISTTFYSVRGGVGRSTSLAYVARILASRGRRVVCVDLDIEAPGLASLFGVEADVTADHGVVPLLVSFDQGHEPDVSEHLIRVSTKDELYCLPAGKPDAEYARLLRYINPSAWYTEEKNPLRSLFSALKEKLPFRPDVLLFDSRTGISEISGPLLFDLADLAIIVFFPHPQAENATREVVRALLSARTWRSVNQKKLTPEPRFIVSPIPSSRVPEVVNRYRNRSLKWISDWLSPAEPNGDTPESSLADAVHFVPYRDDIATSDTVVPNQDMWNDYRPIAEWIERFLPASEEADVAVVGESKTTVLNELNFSKGTAEYEQHFLETFVEAGSTSKALAISTPLVLGRKGSGKTAIFRRLLEGDETASLAITAPAPLRKNRPWILSEEGFSEVDAMLNGTNATWSRFWVLLCCIACHYREQSSIPPDAHASIRALLPDRLESELEALSLIDTLLRVEKISLLANDWFERVDRAIGQPLILLFDALDTGFGNGEVQRQRRREAIEGLCALLIQQSENTNLKFKIVLREDIWKGLRFENKSHLYGRYVTLDWHDQSEFYKIVIKHALKSSSFAETLRASDKTIDSANVDRWSSKEVDISWNLLVGQRMRGGRTAFTKNWVWNRLADANADHSPRYLLQMFTEVTSWERNEQARSPYDRSVIRPRALIQSLPNVSDQALNALKEEYRELEPLFNKLQAIGRTPVASEELGGLTEEVALAREVGLLGVYEGSEEEVERYRVPEIYRYALGMTRKGQA